MRILALGSVVLSAFLAACHDRVLGPETAGESAVEFRVSAQPLQWGGFGPPFYVYSWSSGPASRVTVARASDPGTPVWEVVRTTAAGIRSPLYHGKVPEGAVATADVETHLSLTGGSVTYRVSVTLLDGRTASVEFTSVEFTS